MELAIMLHPLYIPTITTVELWRFPLIHTSIPPIPSTAPSLSLSSIFPQEARPSSHNRRREVPRARQCIGITASKIPLRREAAWTRQELNRHETTGQCRDGSVDQIVISTRV